MRILTIAIVFAVAAVFSATASASVTTAPPSAGAHVQRFAEGVESTGIYEVYRTEFKCERQPGDRFRTCLYGLFLNGLTPEATDNLAVGTFRFWNHRAWAFSTLHSG